MTVHVEVEHLVRVTAPHRDGDKPDVVRTYTLAQLVQAGYDWGRVDGARTARGEQPWFTPEETELSTAGVTLAELRAKFGESVAATREECGA